MILTLAFWSMNISLFFWRSHFINTNVESINKIRTLYVTTNPLGAYLLQAGRLRIRIIQRIFFPSTKKNKFDKIKISHIKNRYDPKGRSGIGSEGQGGS
jgi:hypothetical protein